MTTTDEQFYWWRHSPYCRYLSARALATLATQMMVVAIGWHIYDINRSAFDLGLVGLAQFLPSLLLMLVVGQVADSHSRKLIICVCQIAQCVIATTLAYCVFVGVINREVIFALVFAMGVARAFESPATSAFLPQLVPEKWFPRAVSINSANQQATTIAGPALGGLLYIAGPAVVYVTVALLFLAASLLTRSIRVNSTSMRREPVDINTLFAGFAYIWRNPVLFGAISLDMFAVLLGGATALLPIYAREILHTGPWGLGLLRSAPAIGALLMSIYLVRFPLERRVGKIMFAAVAVFGIATLAFALSHFLWLSLIALFILGASDMISMVIRSSLVQLEAPNDKRGRVSAVNSVFISSSNQLGEFESGITAAWFGVIPAAVIGGVGTLLVVVLWIKLFPALAQRDRLVYSYD